MFCNADQLNDMLNGTKVESQSVLRRYGYLTADQRKIALRRVRDAGNRAWLTNKAPKRCAGLAGTDQPCVFALGPQPAPAQVHGKSVRCKFCDLGRLARDCGTQKKKDRIKRQLARMGKKSRRIAIEERIPAEHREDFRSVYQRAVSRPRPPALDKSWVGLQPYTEEELEARYAAGRKLWEPILRERGMIAQPAATEAEYRQVMLADRKKTLSMMRSPEAHVRHPHGAPVSNEDPLPKANGTRLSANLQLWCEFNSWQVCGNCQSMVQRNLEPAGLEGLLDPRCRECVNCRLGASQKLFVPSREVIPDDLQGLSMATRSALSPLEAHFGPEQRSKGASGQPNGYREHSAMVTFRWHPTAVEDRITKLPTRAERDKAQRALKYLLRHSGKGDRETAYGDFYDRHWAFLERHAFSPGHRDRHLPLRFIEQVGLECALWPDLFPNRSDTITWTRAQTLSRQARAHGTTLEQRMHPESFEDDDDDDHEESGSFCSTKRAFAALALAPALDYGVSYELLHFAFDLNLWTTLGSKKNKGLNVPMRLLMRGHPFSEEYWLDMHLALVDMVRQKGYPPLFTTRSPLEWSMPYHVWIVDAMAKTRLGRMRCALPETLHQAHLLVQVEMNFVAGSNKKAERAKKGHAHQLLQLRRSDGGVVELASFIRLEFQTGKRRKITQDYHGTGRPHSHALHFVNGNDRKAELKALRLERCMAATLDTDSIQERN